MSSSQPADYTRQRSPEENVEEWIAFVGVPNSGKTTLFNALTGLRQKVGNFPGVTIEPCIGTLRESSRIDVHASVIDLPGTYSLRPKSPDEELTLRVLRGEESKVPRPSKLVIVLDGSSLEKSLFLYTFIAELNIPAIAVVTMVDEIKRGGGTLDDIALERLLGIPIFTVVGHKGVGILGLKHAILSPESYAVPNLAVAAEADIPHRHDFAGRTAAAVVRMYANRTSLALDRCFLHPILGPLAFVIVLGLFFQSIFAWAQPLMDLIDGTFGILQHITGEYVPDGIFRRFIANGLLAGVGSVLVFLPQIVLLNIIVVFLEDCGYLARAAFLADRIMGVFGLQGRSFIPLLGSYACAIPGILSARIIPSEKDRMVTMLIAPLMACSARLPVYTLLIGAFVAPVAIAGIFSLQAIVLAGLYALGGVVGLCFAWLFKKTLFRGENVSFLMEFPPYRLPAAKNVAAVVWNRSKEFLRSAGTVILAFSVILWALTEFPQAAIPQNTSPAVAAQMQLEQSFAGQMGKAAAPMFAPIGFDWHITLGVIGSFAAREVFVSVMGQIYAADVSESDLPLRTVLQQRISLPTALSVLVFYVFALQCMSTVAVLKRESGSWKWAGFAFAYTFALAYSVSWLVYRLAL